MESPGLLLWLTCRAPQPAKGVLLKDIYSPHLDHLRSELDDASTAGSSCAPLGFSSSGRRLLDEGRVSEGVAGSSRAGGERFVQPQRESLTSACSAERETRSTNAFNASKLAEEHTSLGAERGAPCRRHHAVLSYAVGCCAVSVTHLPSTWSLVRCE